MSDRPTPTPEPDAAPPADPFATRGSPEPSGDPFATRGSEVPRADPQLTQPHESGGADPATSPAGTAPRYRVVRSHARGGLGEVFLAEDTELRREVALKEIQARHADHAVNRRRFVLEAEVTGQLEHPGIVPVYGLGAYPDGRPFYAMRFIKGESFQAAIERFHAAEKSGRDPGERRLAFRELLSRFVAVCNAAAYAHSKGVIHRDLKPANVMLGPFGETLVVDWGLAKHLGTAGRGARFGGPAPGGEPAPDEATTPGSTPPVTQPAMTQAGTTLGTPAYMPPEQAEGRVDLLGPGADVYSLGAVLYAILSGRPPVIDSSVETTLSKVIAGEWEPPVRVKPGVPNALDAVCRRAMAMRPEDRYGSALLLAADVEAWLADEPVSAYREPFSARLARWGRRHRTLLAVAAVSLVTAVTALAVGIALLWREQAHTEAQRQRAEDNFQTALKAVDDMLTEVAEEQLAFEPRMEAKRRALLAKARDYFVQFLAQKGDDPGIRDAAARAHKRLGDIARLLGDYGEARQSYGRANDLFGSLPPGEGDDPGRRHALAESLTFLGEVDRLDSRPEAAARSYEQARVLLGALAEQFPDRPAYRKDLARVYYNLGILDKDTGRPREAEQSLDRAVGILKALAADFPRDAGYRQHLARGYLNLGPVLRAAGRTGRAEEVYREAIVLQQELAESDPGNPDYRHELAVTSNNLGYLLESTGRVAESGAAYRRSVDLFEKLAFHFPGIPVYRRELANTLNNLAIVLARGKDLLAAEEAWRRALGLFENLAEEHPGVADYQGGAAMAIGNLGWLRLQTKQPAEARVQLEKAIARLSAPLRANPNHPAHLQALRDQHQYLAEALLLLGDTAGAAKAAEKLPEISRDGPGSSYAAAVLLARCMGEEKDAATASAYGRRSLELLRRAVETGYVAPAGLQDAAFDRLRRNPDFTAPLAELERRVKAEKP